MRGGSWLNNQRNARVANRNRNTPGNVNDNLGFRCASSPPSGVLLQSRCRPLYGRADRRWELHPPILACASRMGCKQGEYVRREARQDSSGWLVSIWNQPIQGTRYVRKCLGVGARLVRGGLLSEWSNSKPTRSRHRRTAFRARRFLVLQSGGRARCQPPQGLPGRRRRQSRFSLRQ